MIADLVLAIHRSSLVLHRFADMATVVVVGIGELGSVFARGLLRCGHTVVPVTRATSMSEVAPRAPEPALVLLAVAEGDLDGVLTDLPGPWRTRVGLLQNELRPSTWRAHGIEHPTVAVVWFEKKPKTLILELMPSLVFGPQAGMLTEALEGVGVTTRVCRSESELTRELAAKNLYIGTTNIAGLVRGGTVSELWRDHRPLAVGVARDVLAIERALCDESLDEAAMLFALETAIAADPDHACSGRSAPARLERALAHAERLALPVPALRRIAESRA